MSYADLVHGSGYLVAALVAAAALAALLRLAPRIGLVDSPDERKRHVGTVPLVGGLSILAGLLAGACVVGGFQPFGYALLGTTTAIVVIGALDDRVQLGVRRRVIVQSMVIAVMLIATGVHVAHLGSLFGFSAALGWFGFPFTLIALIGLLNAFNLMDGIDGLASALGLVAIGGIVLTAGTLDSLADYALLILAGVAMLPQLAANLGLFGSRNRCFLGDAGSTLIGYLIGWSLILYSQTPGTRLSPVGALWCVAVPVLDTLAVMTRRIRARVSPFKPDRRHIHYLLIDAGMDRRLVLPVIVVAAMAFWGFGALVRDLEIGSGANLVACCVLLVAYIYVTAKLDKWVRAHPRGVIVPTPRVPREAALGTQSAPAAAERRRTG